MKTSLCYCDSQYFAAHHCHAADGVAGDYWIDWRLGLVMLLIFPLLVPFYYWRRPAMRRQMQTLGKRTSV